MAVALTGVDISTLTTTDVATLIDDPRPVVVVVPVGSVEPHGPHLSLVTDTAISRSAAVRAVPLLAANDLLPLLGPAVPYGVTECASAFPGAVSIAPEALSVFLGSMIRGYLATGIDHVCLVNNHLEPAQHHAVLGALEGIAPSSASVACPLSRRWARTLSPEFKRGECHAGEYETSILLAAHPELVDETSRLRLPKVPVSLSDALVAGVTDFVEMGLVHAYAGAPAEATAAHGHEMLDRLATMIATVIFEAMDGSSN